MRCALVLDGVIENIVVGELAIVEAAFPDHRVVSLADGLPCSPGDSWNGHACVRPAPNQPQEPDWLAFRLEMLNNSGYQRIISFVDQVPSMNALIITPLIGAILQNPPHLPSVAMLWNNMLELLPVEIQPTAIEVQGWQEIAQASQVPIAFLESGTIAA